VGGPGGEAPGQRGPAAGGTTLGVQAPVAAEPRGPYARSMDQPNPDPDALPPVRLLLIGMMGSGKTTIGRHLAAQTGWPYIDNDELLLLTTGKTARELLAHGGEASLRAGESAVVDRALQLDPPVIVGIAGGVVLDPAARARLPLVGHVVWLRARAETLLPRLGPGDHRPFMEGNLDGWVRRMIQDRAHLYEAVAGTIVDVDDRTPGEIVADILAGLQTAPIAAPAPSESGRSAADASGA
jgi:shikimate kinase